MEDSGFLKMIFDFEKDHEDIISGWREEIGTIGEIYEPYLMRIGFLARTPRGRIVTESGYKHIGREYIINNRLI